MAAKAETQTGARIFGGQADGCENMRRLDRTGRAGGAGGASQTFQVESDEQGFAFDARKNKIGGVGSTRRAAPIDARMGHAVEQAMLERLDGAEFVVGMHNGDEHGFRTESAAQVFKVN